MAELCTTFAVNADLDRGVKKTYLDMLFVTNDNEAHRVDVQLYRGKNPQELGGAGVSAYFIRYSDNATIPLTGEASGNVVSVKMKKSCYNKPGQFALIVKATIGGVTSTVFYGEGTIFVSSTDKVLNDEDIIPTLDDLLAQIAAMESASSRANTAADRVERMQIDASGLAGDANRLGGKPPEYYIQPLNLLDNSWWKNPKEIVNQRGATSAAAWRYVIDRWSGYEYDTSLQMDNDGLTLLDSTYLIQHVPMHKFTIGKWYTIALYFADGTVDVGSGCINQSHLEGYQDIIVSQGLSCVISCRGSNEYLDFGILCRNKAIRACALYEGQYTAETLPPYVPKGYAAELAECRRYYRKEKINCLFVPTYSSILNVLIVHDDMYALPTVTVINAKFMNTDLEKWEQWVWTDITSLYRSAEFGKRSSIWVQFVDDSYPFITKTNYRGEIEYEASADL